MNNIVIGLAAHVDAGKTTLAEELLFAAGSIRKKGRVDSGNAYLDNSSIEKSRGITVFSHQAVFRTDKLCVTLLDTPGHADFASHARQCISVMDMCILLISASDGIQSHTRTLWKLLEKDKIPVFLFVNKTDLQGIDRERLAAVLNDFTGGRAADLSGDIYENCAFADESLFEKYEDGTLSDEDVTAAIAKRDIFPVMWGSALRSEGIAELISMIDRFAPVRTYGSEFAAKVFKLTSDGKNTLAHIKVTGGTLRVKDETDGIKVNELRIYSGEKYEQAGEVCAGQCAAFVTDKLRPGDGMGAEPDRRDPLIPLISYVVTADCDEHTLYERMKAVETDIPTLSPTADGKVSISVMGDMELDVISTIYREKFGGEVSFGQRHIRYLETIRGSVTGYGHYEPLRHYGEAVVRLEAAPRGSGITVSSECPEDLLSTARQKSIISVLENEVHYGVLTGSPLTDVHIILTGGRIHVKHTEGGDLRQAARRAVRQALMQAESILLEPCYEYALELPLSSMGRAMTDLDLMGATASPEIDGDTAVIRGRVPAAGINGYHTEVASYTGGTGRLQLDFCGYFPVSDPTDIIAQANYDPLADTANSPDSIFCIKGAAAVIRWDEAPSHMHTAIRQAEEPSDEITPARIAQFKARLYSDDELMAIFERTYGKIDRPKRSAMRRDDIPVKRVKPAPVSTGPDYLLVDGYNIIFAWDELRDLARTSLDHARKRLTDILANFAGFKGCQTILVFDAYKIKGGTREIEQESGITVVYTKEAETADMYIERTTHDIKGARRIRVATSDYAEQLIILGNGALRVPAGKFYEEVKQVENARREHISDSR